MSAPAPAAEGEAPQLNPYPRGGRGGPGFRGRGGPGSHHHHHHHGGPRGGGPHHHHMRGGHHHHHHHHHGHGGPRVGGMPQGLPPPMTVGGMPLPPPGFMPPPPGFMPPAGHHGHHHHHHHRGGRGGFGRGGHHHHHQAPPPRFVDPAIVSATAGGEALPVAEPETPPPPPVAPDEALIQQFTDRYALQSEHESINYDATVGTLNVDDCLQVIADNDVTFVVTDTGTGKSSLVPKALLEAADGSYRIANSQPRRTATINLAHRVAFLRNEQVGKTVGYWVRGDHCGSPETCRLMYMTSYTLLLHVIGNPDNSGFTHIIIDEFHERQPDVEVLLGLLKLAIQRTREASAASGKPSLKIILMSASVELELWKKYFDGLSVGEYSTCNPRYTVHDYYQEEVCRLVGAASVTPPQQDGVEAQSIVSSLQLKNNLFLVKKMLEFLAQHADPKNSILVFLPGRTVVEELAAWVHENFPQQLDPIPWYRDMELSKIQANLKREATTKKKVYLATDIAEVSLTLPDVVFVIDSGTTKKPRIDPNNRNSIAFPPLELLWCSRSSVKQRRGRVGRVQQGFYFTMVPESYLPNLLEMEPQIANSTIHELALHALQVSDNPLGCFRLCRVGPKPCSVQFSMQVLLDGGYTLPFEHSLAANESFDSDVNRKWRSTINDSFKLDATTTEPRFVATLKGKLAQFLPLGIENSSLIYLGLLFGMESLAILGACISSCGTPFYTVVEEGEHRGNKKRDAIDQTVEVMKRFNHGLPSDIVAAVGLLIEFKKMHSSGLSEEAENRWCREHCVMRSRLMDILHLEAQVKLQLAEQCSFVAVEDPVELEQLLAKNAELFSFISAASVLERALYVQFDKRQAQKEKNVGPSIFLGLGALADLFVASVCPWKRGTIVIPLSIQTRYEKLLGTFATQLDTKTFNVLLLLLAPQLVYEQQEKNFLFGVELYGVRQRMSADINTGNEILMVRKALCLKLRLMRYQMIHNVGPDHPDLDKVLQDATDVRLPPTIKRAVDITAFLRFAATTILRNVTAAPTAAPGPNTNNRFVDPSNGNGAPFKPTSWSILVSTTNGSLAYVPPEVPEVEQPELVLPKVFNENDEDDD